MRVPTTRGIALLFTVALAACDTKLTSTGVAGGNTATVRVVNASATSLDVAAAGKVATGNGGLTFGASSTCTATDATTPDLTVRPTGTSTALPGFSPGFARGDQYVVIAYADANAVTRFTTFTTSAFTPASGQAGLKVADATSGTANYDVYVSAPGAALGAPTATNLSFGGSTNYFNIGAGPVQVRLTDAGTQRVVFTAATETLSAGRNYVLVIGPPATGTAELRSFLVAAC